MTPPRLGTSCPAGMTRNERLFVAALFLAAAILGAAVYFGA